MAYFSLNWKKTSKFLLLVLAFLICFTTFSVKSISADQINGNTIVEQHYTIKQLSSSSFEVTEYGDTYQLEFLGEDVVRINDKYISTKDYDLALHYQASVKNTDRKSLVFYISVYDSINYTQKVSDISLRASVYDQPPFSGYGSYIGPFYRPKFDGLYITALAGSISQVASLFGLAITQTKDWIKSALGTMGVSSAFVTGHLKVWTAPHTTCLAAAKDRIQPALKSNGSYYDAKTPSESPIYYYETYWYTDPSGYTGC